jgi:16S rRNA (uracil1498-N3)-methyltransferase
MTIFYQPTILETLALNEEESKHAIRVLRMNMGDEIGVLDGKGTIYHCKITIAKEKKCEVRIVSSHYTEKRLYKIHLAIAPTKNLDRMEWLVEKCTEMGIDEISFLQTRYSERKEIKIERLHKIAISALKQSQNRHLPVLHEMVKIGEFLKKNKQESIDNQRFIGYVSEQYRTPLKQLVTINGSYLILIGPEGDFSEDEITQAISLGFQPVSLGNSRLRTETAGLVACHSFHLLNEG